MPSSTEIRETFIKYFTERGHVHVPSSSVVPENDDSILFVNSGMCQFKDIFLGKKKPEHEAVCNYQKCIRLSGKHNDLDDIGKDTYHHSFFEMLGTWSFGKYYKEETIAYAWDLLTNVYKLDPSRLYVTYFDGDGELDLLSDVETREIWKKYLPEERILPFGMKDNFWEMAATGPCGPCTEIHYSYLEGDQSSKVNMDDQNVIEIWNMVFMEYNRIDEKTFLELDTKFVDTGMGFERLVAVLQGKTSNYDTDLFEPIMNTIQKCNNYTNSNNSTDKHATESYYETTDEELKKAYRIIADHIRCVMISLDDNVLFGNTGREYVVRKIYRRMAYYMLNVIPEKKGLDVYMVAKILILEHDKYPELVKYLTHPDGYFMGHFLDETKKYESVLKGGIRTINKIIRKTGTLTGTDMGKLYETYGLPPIVTKDICEKKGIHINMDEYDIYMLEHKQKSSKH